MTQEPRGFRKTVTRSIIVCGAMFLCINIHHVIFTTASYCSSRVLVGNELRSCSVMCVVHHSLQSLPAAALPLVCAWLQLLPDPLQHWLHYAFEHERVEA
jgi:hypothetical protein